MKDRQIDGQMDGHEFFPKSLYGSERNPDIRLDKNEFRTISEESGSLYVRNARSIILPNIEQNI